MLIYRLLSCRWLKSSGVVHKSSANAASKMASSDGISSNGVGSASSMLVWIDLEMSGLNVESDVIMEIGCLVTNKNLELLDEGINIVVRQPDSVLNNMGDWCKNQHGLSGLTEACRTSQISVEEAESRVLAYIKGHVVYGQCPLAGSSVHVDRMFLLKYMPRLMDHLHYRIVDVSTVKELCRRWYSKEFSKAPPKSQSHRSIDDVKESIAELKYYQSSIFK